MKRLSWIGPLMLLLVFAFAGSASASTLTFLGTEDPIVGSSNPAAEIAFLESLGAPDDLILLGKSEDGTEFGDIDGSGINWGSDTSGEVTYTGSLDELYMVLKYSQARDGYFVSDIQAMNGVIPWPGAGNIEQGISHISFYGGDGNRIESVPEPTSAALFMLGLVATGGALRRRGSRR